MALSTKKAKTSFQDQAPALSVGSRVVVSGTGVGVLKEKGSIKVGNWEIDGVRVVYTDPSLVIGELSEQVVKAGRARPLVEARKVWEDVFASLAKPGKYPKKPSGSRGIKVEQDLQNMAGSSDLQGMADILRDVKPSLKPREIGDNPVEFAFHDLAVKLCRLIAIELAAVTRRDVTLCTEHVRRVAIGKEKKPMAVFDKKHVIEKESAPKVEGLPATRRKAGTVPPKPEGKRGPRALDASKRAPSLADTLDLSISVAAALHNAANAIKPPGKYEEWCERFLSKTMAERTAARNQPTQPIERLISYMAPEMQRAAEIYIQCNSKRVLSSLILEGLTDMQAFNAAIMTLADRKIDGTLANLKMALEGKITPPEGAASPQYPTAPAPK